MVSKSVAPFLDLWDRGRITTGEFYNGVTKISTRAACRYHEVNASTVNLIVGVFCCLTANFTTAFELDSDIM